MSKRTIKTTLGSYVNEHGQPTYGWKGDEVEVHEDYVKEFDKHNVEVEGEPYEAERVGMEMVSPATAADEPKKASAKKAT